MSLRKSFFSKVRFGVRDARSRRTLVGSRNTFFSTPSGYYGGYYGSVGRSSSRGWRGDAPVRRTGPRRYRFHAAVKPLLLHASSPYPYQIDLNELITTYSPAVFNLLEVNEHSISALSGPWNADDPFATLSEDGILSYAPRGTWTGNVLILKVEVADAYHPPTPLALVNSNTYGMKTEVEKHGIQEPLVEETVIVFSDDVIGNPEAEHQFWTRQSTGPTCAIATTASMLAAAGVTNEDGDPITYLDVLSDVTVEHDENGNQIGGLPPILGSNGLPEYILTRLPDGSFKVDRPRDANGVVKYSSGWQMIRTILNYYNLETHTGYAKHFSTIINELEAGNKVAAYVDSNEFISHNYVKRIWDETDAVHLNGLYGSPTASAAGHAIWITGIDYSDPENPVVIINDTGRDSGRSARYSLEQFLAAWEDSGFKYTATGEHAPDEAAQQNRVYIENTLRRYFVVNQGDKNIGVGSNYEAVTTGFFEAFITNPQLMREIDKHYPGTQAAVARYLVDVRREEQRVLSDYGIDPQLIKTIFFNIDVHEQTEIDKFIEKYLEDE